VGRAAFVIALSFFVAGGACAQAGDAPGRYTVGVDALVWTFNGSRTPPLVSDGFLDDPATKVLLGGEDMDTNPNPGLRLTVSRALSERSSLEASALYFRSRSTSKSVSSSGQPDSTNIFVPVFDAFLGAESLENISAAGFFSGAASAELSNNLWGAEFNLATRMVSSGNWRIEGIAGVRYLRFHEKLFFTTDSPNLPPQPADVYHTEDKFTATNHFFGGQLGARARGDWGSWFGGGSLKVGIGMMRQSVNVEGTLLTNDFNNYGTPVAYAGGGYFATPTNVGEYSRNKFALVPELALSIGYRVTPRLSLAAGYSLLYMSDVARAPQQINRTVNYSPSDQPPTLPLGPQEPSFTFKSSDFWAHGFNLGAVYRF